MKCSKRLVCSLFFSIFSIASLTAQQNHNGLYPVEVNGEWGYVDESGNLAIAPQFIGASFFSDGLARVKIGEPFNYDYAFINQKGKVVLKPKGFARHFHEGLAAAENPGHDKHGWGYLDKKGGFAIKPKFGAAYSFCNGLAVAKAKGEDLYGYINKNGEWAIEPRFLEARDFSNGLAPVAMGESEMNMKWGYVNTKGEIAIPTKYNEALIFHEGLAAVAVEVESSIFDDWGYLNTKGEMLIEPQFNKAGAFSGGIAPVQLGDFWKFIDKQGETVLKKLNNDKQFVFAGPFNGKLARIAFQGNFSRGLGSGKIEYTFAQNSKFGYIDRSGRQIWPKPLSGNKLRPVNPPKGFAVFNAQWPSSNISIAYPEDWSVTDLNKINNSIEGVSFMKSKEAAKKLRGGGILEYSGQKVDLGTSNNIIINVKVRPIDASNTTPEKFLASNYGTSIPEQSPKAFFKKIQSGMGFDIAGKPSYMKTGMAKNLNGLEVSVYVVAAKRDGRMITITKFIPNNLKADDDLMFKMMENMKIASKK